MIYLIVASACVVAMQRNIPIRSSALGRDTCRHGRSKAKLLRSSSRWTWLAACSGLLIITQFPDNTPTLCNFMLRQFGAICPATLQIFRLNSFCTRGSDHSARSPAAGSFPCSENLWNLTGIYRSCNDQAHMEIFPDLPQIMPHYSMKRCNSFLKHTTSNSELATFPLLLNRSIKYGIRSSKTIDDPNLAVVLANYERHYPSDSASPRHKQFRRDVQPRCSRGQQICNEDLAHFPLRVTGRFCFTTLSRALLAWTRQLSPKAHRDRLERSPVSPREAANTRCFDRRCLGMFAHFNFGSVTTLDRLSLNFGCHKFEFYTWSSRCC